MMNYYNLEDIEDMLVYSGNLFQRKGNRKDLEVRKKM